MGAIHAHPQAAFLPAFTGQNRNVYSGCANARCAGDGNESFRDETPSGPRLMVSTVRARHPSI